MGMILSWINTVLSFFVRSVLPALIILAAGILAIHILMNIVSKALEKTKADLLSSENNLRLANDKAQDLSIKKLTKGAPSVAKEFGL